MSSDTTPAGEAIHLTLFNFKAGLAEDEIERILNVTRALGGLDTVKHLVIGPAAPAVQPCTGRFDYVSIVGFDNNTDHDVYMVCPERMAMGAVFMPNQVGWLAADMHHPGLGKLWAISGDRLRHVMFFDFQAKVPAAERTRLIAALEAFGADSGALAFTLSRNLQKWTPNSPAQWVLIADFRDQAAFDAWRASAAYQALVEDDLLHKTSMMFTADLPISARISGA